MRYIVPVDVELLGEQVLQFSASNIDLPDDHDLVGLEEMVSELFSLMRDGDEVLLVHHREKPSNYSPPFKEQKWVK